MYLIGTDHPHKFDARRFLEEAVSSERRLVTDAEVFQEILHRYQAIERPDAIQPAFELLSSIIDEIFPVTPSDVFRAKDIVLGYAKLSARDAVHISVMIHNKMSEVMTFDRGFETFPGITIFS
jgi:hypothetical protein